MNRITIIQDLINKHKYSKYLEIGTFKGVSFLPIKCKKKIAVDPFFQITFRQKLKWILKNPYNICNKYFEMTSDNFFASQEVYLKKRGKQDIVFLDGLHTFNATLNDALNSIKYLQKEGVIILHDCLPPHRAAATYAENIESAAADRNNIEGWTGEWCGDTWKVITYLRRQYPEKLNVFVLNVDYGLGVIKILSDNKNLDLAINKRLFDEVNKLSYDDLIKNPKEIIGLVEKSFYKTL